MSSELYNLRPSTFEDFTFVREIYHTILKDQVEPIWGWDDTFQEVQNNNSFKPQEFEIIEVDGKSVGILETERLSDAIYMKSISIQPEFRGRGIGTKVLSSLIDKGRDLNFGIVLRVLKTNTDAKRLYERLGFQTYEETGRHFKMKRDLD